MVSIDGAFTWLQSIMMVPINGAFAYLFAVHHGVYHQSIYLVSPSRCLPLERLPHCSPSWCLERRKGA